MPVLAAKDYLGSCIIKKTGGGASPAIGTQYVIPSAQISAQNPINTSFPALIAGDSSIRNAVLGKRTPNITISTMLKASFCSSALFNSLIMSSDANKDTDEFVVILVDGEGNVRQYQNSRCAGISIAASGAGGPISIQFSFLSVKGDSDGTPITYTAASIDPGYMTPVSGVDFNATADGVTGFSLSLLKAQGYQFFLDGTLFAANVVSGMFSGSLSIAQSPRATTVPSTGATIKLGVASSGIQISTALVLNAFQRNMSASLGSIANSYSLVDLTTAGVGVPCVITSF
jgi:hypothetical protein